MTSPPLATPRPNQHHTPMSAIQVPCFDKFGDLAQRFGLCGIVEARGLWVDTIFRLPQALRVQLFTLFFFH